MDPGFLMRLIAEYTYLIIAPAALALGPIVGLVAGVLLRLDIIDLVPTCLALATGELGGDILWYWLGRRYGNPFVGRFGRFIGVTERAVSSAKNLFEQHHDMIIFSSKLTSGFGFGSVIMFTAGLSHVPFRRYMMLNIAGQFLWTTGLLSIGYFLGHIYLRVGNVFEKMALVGLAVLIIVSLVGFGRYLRAYLIHSS